MPTPFPGMDPYLERPGLWHGVHNRLIAARADLLGPLLRPRYFVAVEERAYLADPLAIGFATVPPVGVLGPYAVATPMPAGQATGTRRSTVEPLLIELPMPEPVRETYLEIQEVAGNPDAGLWMKSADGDVNIDYRSEPLPPFEGLDAQWVDELLNAAHLR